METKEWRQFCKTGSIEAYLSYREAETDSVRERMCGKSVQEGEEAAADAGFCNCDGNGFTGASRGRI